MDRGISNALCTRVCLHRMGAIPNRKPISLNKENLMESNKLNIRERLIQALDDFGAGNEMYDETNESLADYLIEVIDELRK